MSAMVVLSAVWDAAQAEAAAAAAAAATGAPPPDPAAAPPPLAGQAALLLAVFADLQFARLPLDLYAGFLKDSLGAVAGCGDAAQVRGVAGGWDRVQGSRVLAFWERGATEDEVAGGAMRTVLLQASHKPEASRGPNGQARAVCGSRLSTPSTPPHPTVHFSPLPPPHPLPQHTHMHTYLPHPTPPPPPHLAVASLLLPAVR